MKKFTLVFWLVLLSTIVLAWCNPAPKTADTAVEIIADTNLKEVTGYPIYTEAKLATATNEGKDVALFFNSKTCGSCAKLEADIITNAWNIPANTEIFKVDRDDNQDLAKQLGVAKYHTVVYPEMNNEQVTWLFTLDDLLEEFSSEANAADSVPTAAAPVAAEIAAYETYSEENFQAALDADKKVILNFRASRCPTCTKTSTDLINNQDQIPADVVILETDYDTYTDLKKEYGVIKQTSFSFINADGSFDKTITDIRSMEDLLNNI